MMKVKYIVVVLFILSLVFIINGIYQKNKKNEDLIVDNESIKYNELKIEENIIKESLKDKFVNNLSNHSKIDKVIALKDIDENSMSEFSFGLPNYLFNSGFYTSEYFNQLYNLSKKTIDELELRKYVNILYIGTIKSNYNINTSLNDVVSCNIEIDIKIIDLNNHTIIDQKKISKTSIGFSKVEAKRNTFNKISEIVLL